MIYSLSPAVAGLITKGLKAEETKRERMILFGHTLCVFVELSKGEVEVLTYSSLVLRGSTDCGGQMVSQDTQLPPF